MYKIYIYVLNIKKKIFYCSNRWGYVIVAQGSVKNIFLILCPGKVRVW